MTDITLTYGLPASGKSTWARQMVGDSAGKILRVNMDDIRSMMGFGHDSGPAPWSKELENIALDTQDKAILAAVKGGHDVIVDNTHIEQKMPKRIKRLFDGDVDFHVKDFTDVPVSVCIMQDKMRGGLVGEDVIRKMAGRLSRGSWKLTEEWMNDVTLSAPYSALESVPSALLVDIDGTLAEHVARSPYDYSRVLTDTPHGHIQQMVRYYKSHGFKIIIMSGRPDIDKVRAETEEWLNKYAIPFDRLLMRPADRLTDNDADIKQDLFDKYVRNNYDVRFMLDDRNRVVQRMRKLGIKVLQVAEGDF